MAARGAARGAARERVRRELEAQQRRLERARRRLPGPIRVSDHAIGRWLERAQPDASWPAAEGAIARFVAAGRAVIVQPGERTVLANPDWPGVRVVVEAQGAATVAVTVMFDPDLLSLLRRSA